MSGITVRQRWRNIRDSFTRQWRFSFGKKRKVDYETAKALASCVKWAYYKDLLFLFEPRKASDAEACGEEATNGSASSDTTRNLVEEATDDTTGSGDFESPDPLEPSDAVEAAYAGDGSEPSIEPSEAVKALAEKMTNGSATSDAAELSAGEEAAAACNGDNSASSMTLLQSPVENTVVPAAASTPKVDLGPSFAKRRRLLPKGLVVSDVRSIREDSSVSKPTNGPSLQGKRPSLPVNGLSPRTAEVSKPSGPRAEEPAVKSSSAAPNQMDHISHFLCSLERYVRKTADNIQPQLMMELLNVASSYSENVYPVLLFPRT